MKYIIMGDSISEGIGSKKMNYESTLLQYCPKIHLIKNYAKTGTTIEYANKIVDEVIECQPDIAIIMYGCVDAQIRPNLEKNKYGICSLIPRRYKIGGMLSPRAFYSKKWYRYIPDRIDNLIRFFLNRIVLFTQGTVQWIPIQQFENLYREFVSEMKRAGIKKRILVSTVYIDDHYFFNSSREYEKYNTVIQKIAIETNSQYVDIYYKLKRSVACDGWDTYYSHDHFHPNENGYKLIANSLAEAIKSMEE